MVEKYLALQNIFSTRGWLSLFSCILSGWCINNYAMFQRVCFLSTSVRENVILKISEFFFGYCNQISDRSFEDGTLHSFSILL